MNRPNNMKEYKELANKLRKARQELSLTQLQVAKKLRRSQSYISKVESGEQKVDAIELKVLASVYDKNLSYFL